MEAIVRAKLQGLAWLRRNAGGYGEDGIYFDCRDSAHHKTCSGRWRGMVSRGYAADGERIRKKLSGQTRTEVKDKLKALHAELDAGVGPSRTSASP